MVRISTISEHIAAVDRDVLAGSLVAAADAGAAASMERKLRGLTASLTKNRTIFDDDAAAVALVAAADTGAAAAAEIAVAFASGCVHPATDDLDEVAMSILAAADARAAAAAVFVGAARGFDHHDIGMLYHLPHNVIQVLRHAFESLAVNDDGAAVLVVSAADACTACTTLGRDFAVHDRDGAGVRGMLVVALAAADAGAALAARGRYGGVVDGDLAVGAAFARADGCRAFAARGVNGDAVDRDLTGPGAAAAADARVPAAAVCDEVGRPALSVDGQLRAALHLDALKGLELASVGDDDAYVALDDDALIVAALKVFEDIPAVAKAGVDVALVENLVFRAVLLRAVFVDVRDASVGRLAAQGAGSVIARHMGLRILRVELLDIAVPADPLMAFLAQIDVSQDRIVRAGNKLCHRRFACVNTLVFGSRLAYFYVALRFIYVIDYFKNFNQIVKLQIHGASFSARTDGGRVRFPSAIGADDVVSGQSDRDIAAVGSVAAADTRAAAGYASPVSASALRIDISAGYYDRAARFVIAAADTRAAAFIHKAFRVNRRIRDTAAICFDGTAGDRDGAAVSVVSSANAGAAVIKIRAVTAVGRDVAAGDRDHSARTVVAAAYACPGVNVCSSVAACCVDLAAGDRDGSAVSVFTAADARACGGSRESINMREEITAFGCDIAAGNSDTAAAAFLAAADACAGSAAGGCDRAAGDRDRTAAVGLTAADARAVISAGRRDGAAGDRDGAAGLLVAAADARGLIAALGNHRAAEDVDRGGVHLLAAASDARAAAVARGVDAAAVDVDRADRGIADAGVFAADARAGVARGHQLAGLAGLAVDIDRVALRDDETFLAVERGAVAQDDADGAADGELALDGDAALDGIVGLLPGCADGQVIVGAGEKPVCIRGQVVARAVFIDVGDLGLRVKEQGLAAGRFRRVAFRRVVLCSRFPGR